MSRMLFGAVAPIAGAAAVLAAGATAAQDLARMTVHQVYSNCPFALKRYAPQLMTTHAQSAYRNYTLAQAGVQEPELRRIATAIRNGDCSDAEVNSALDADQAAKPDRPRDRNSSSGSPPPELQP